MSYDTEEEEWECPACHETVMVGYYVHKGCFNDAGKKLIAEFQEDIKDLERANLNGSITYTIERKNEKWEGRAK